MVRRTKEEAQETRSKILNAASKVFCDKGYANSSLEDVAKEANVTRGAIYWHFKNKTDIFEALHDELRCPLIKLLLNDLETDHYSPIDQLQENCTKFLIDLSKNDHLQRVLTLFMKKSDYSGELEYCKKIHTKNKSEQLKLFSDYFDRAKPENKQLQHLDSDSMALSISCFMKGIIIEFLDNPTTMNIEKRAPQMMEIFFSGLKQK